MLAFLLHRILHAFFVMLGISFVVFILIHLSGDPAAMMVPEDATPQQVQEIRERMGFDRPILVQYGLFLGRALQGDFGYSYRIRRPALDLVVERIPATLRLAVTSAVVSLGLGIPVGILAATRQGSFFDRLSMMAILFGQSMPTFWLGIMLILIVSVQLGWLPTSGYRGPEYIILPAVTLGLYTSAMVARILRSSLIEVLSHDYIRTARSKGLADRTILTRHALKNAAIPVVTVIGLQIGYLLGGSVVTETVFSYPGMGLLAIQAIRGRDIPVLQAFVVSISAVIVLLNLLVDVLYTYLDPRIRY
ncbi:ABC transporter permease [Thermomicrobiaceae bacterium CFH 74404]|uniref:ABC transporter permease n=1 Tax=Thermalbibacter longus TaxID=2951981 RepID=A0AA41WGG3_9BACT|nr:ABC transporter permease [Thermalbibacter longus]MCM8749950.1 ABC transporter permease [Thermalbibacter longus]